MITLTWVEEVAIRKPNTGVGSELLSMYSVANVFKICR